MRLVRTPRTDRVNKLISQLLAVESNVVIPEHNFSGKNGWQYCVLCNAGSNLCGDTVMHESDCPIEIARCLRNEVT